MRQNIEDQKKITKSHLQAWMGMQCNQKKEHTLKGAGKCVVENF